MARFARRRQKSVSHRLASPSSLRTKAIGGWLSAPTDWLLVLKPWRLTGLRFCAHSSFSDFGVCDRFRFRFRVSHLLFLAGFGSLSRVLRPIRFRPLAIFPSPAPTHQARRRVDHMRRMRAALRAQTAFRRHSSRRKFLSLKGAALALQCATRWRRAVAEHRRLKRDFMATKLQSWHRMLAPWKAFRQLRSATLALQCRQRQRVAYGELRDLRIKAKDVGNLKEDNELSLIHI